MKSQSDENKIAQHLAGIVPIAGLPLDYHFPWHDSMLPIDKDLLAIERSIIECAYAGCKTIWVVCHMKTEPILKKRVGTFVTDPVTLQSYNKREIRHIPIYYVPIHPRDKLRRDGLGWSVLYGAKIANFIGRKFSQWIVPDKFYCSFPYGICNLEDIRNNRDVINSNKTTVIMHDGLSVKDNLHISFTFKEEDYFNCKNTLQQKDLEVWERTKRAALFYDLKTSFSKLNFDNSNVINLSWFYDISTWERYKTFISSENSNLLIDRKLYLAKYNMLLAKDFE